MKKANLLSIPTLVEAPFIIVTIGNHTFGMPSKKGQGLAMTVEFPNFMESLTVVKVNGEVNTYQLRMTYAIKQGDDPNLIDNILSSVSGTRKMTISYGDWCSPGNIYKEEEALITNVRSQIQFQASKISYDIQAVSSGTINLMSRVQNFPATVEKPSTVILKMLTNPKYGIQQNFTGMASKQKVLQKNLIAVDDRAVLIEAKNNISTYDYIQYLVQCMIPSDEYRTGETGKAYYALSVIDDNKNDMGGSYFTVTQIGNSGSTPDDKNSYTLDVGYPGNNFITNFSINDTETWSILFDSSEANSNTNFAYTYDIYGNLISSDSPSVTRSKDFLRTTAADNAWWTKMTEFPIKATIEFKGLVRPTMLVSYVQLDCRFYGHQTIHSGTYIIIKQTDNITTNGYKTTLELQRIKGVDGNPNTASKSSVAKKRPRANGGR